MIVPEVETNPFDFDDWRGLEQLLRCAYAPMKGRIDPPSFLNTMNRADIIAKARTEDLFIARDGERPVACGFGTPVAGVYEVGKVAVAASNRGMGLCRRVMQAAEEEARRQGISGLQLYARVELTENHQVYAALGFERVGTMTHPGFGRPTAIRFHRAVCAPPPLPPRPQVA